ncbi:L-serine ammonia-lyase, iron-sulfur-dependent, subunit alpha [Athalassotoga saccharophila]|uniref:L-serine ammonia-lyase, iron-sulfur-dependent, subunit alpha n=1 Tax=Athalassotoga saccharophila TaxID=1441386 RepID=UPI00137ABB58|nr:L-serine ammonia-lyase, iron-sulfur-dependent, subunit alpha [Athalassotoga saccharophila]BBJ28613.1 L-serine dehydratase, alpha chain [Athalassotoga saccharophila]
MNVKSLKDLIDICEKTGETLHKVIMDWEMLDTGYSNDYIIEKTSKLLSVMEEEYASKKGKEFKTLIGLTGSNGKKMLEYLPKAYVGENVFKAATIAVTMSESNASMGRIVACPTAGSSGVMPGVLLTLEESGIERDKLVLALIVAGGIGKIISMRASLSGAEAGCQAEIGSATAMAAGGAVYAMGGSPQAVSHAAALSLKSLMGLVCDPVGGFVEVPCVKRNAAGATLALLFADIAMAGVESVIPFDEVVDAMMAVGRSMPEALRETGKGGIAISPTARRIMKNLKDKLSIPEDN